MITRNHVALPLAVSLALLNSGCSGGFEKQWRLAGAAPASRDAYEGRWEGKWISRKHRNAEGRLRCIMTATGPAKYHARFKANWMIFSSTYATDFEVQRKRGAIAFSGAQDLGALYGGMYRFVGTATPQRFRAGYDSSYDTGTFAMEKVRTDSAR